MSHDVQTASQTRKICLLEFLEDRSTSLYVLLLLQLRCWYYTSVGRTHTIVRLQTRIRRNDGTENLGFRICIGFGLTVQPFPHIVVFRVCLYNGFLCCGFLCARLISVFFRLLHRGLPRPYRYIQANRLPHLQGYHTRATTLHTNIWVLAGYHTCG